ncbi:transcriptional regulator PpsR [Rhodovulum bhavnagarense]|uniref:Transcriptional regulator PpsR n=1 Tax=Rhodovulum bhavnagarense TaxID=992286 RepID=A0A4R2RDA4_9RHOB|nr:transcriptional regulator PpsR [Rhodovulum bhavnagarense]TCP59947.1 transcriptional regulator PpsR [Rhodovulum bhavnagarense]
MTSRGTKYWSSGAIPLIAPEMLGEIIATAADLSLVITREGKILSALVNRTHRAFGQLDHWEGQNIRDILTEDSRPKLEARLELLAGGGDSDRLVELNHAEGEGWDFPVRYSFHRIGPDESVLLMLGRDLRPIAEMQMQLIEAQMALERDYETQREYDTRYRVLTEATRDAFLFVGAKSGRVVDANPVACELLGLGRNDLIGSSLVQEFEGRRRAEFMEALTRAATDDEARPLDLETRRTGQAVRLTAIAFRAAGERLVLCRLDPVATAVQTDDEMTGGLKAMYHHGVDAIVFTDRDGVILSANESFLGLTDSSQLSTVKGRSLGDFLVRGSVDLRVLVENATRTGQMRMFATKLSGEYGAQVSVEISATYLADQASPAIVFIIRDASRMEVVRKPGVAVSDDAMRSVMELVGSATLKDIVAETTDVVEKMCIETAVELTRNNRVAAAEMLGLSRQSLYVKLRKYGLLARDGADH